MDTADIVGVDIGGTKTCVRVRYRDGSHHEAVTPTAQWRPVEQDRNPLALLSLLGNATELTAGTVVGVGAHGCDTRSQCQEFAEALSARSPATFLVVNDAELLVPAAGLDTGLGLVVGTGSIVVGQDAAGDLISTGGWGWLLGDPGSGPALVRESAKQVLAAADAGRAPDALGRALCAAYGVDTALQLAYCLTAARSITHWASRAPLVFDAARDGSTLARAVLDQQLDQLVGQVSALRGRGARGEHVVLGGGVISGQPEYAKALADRLTVRTGLTTIVLDGDPVQGAMTLAERHRDGDPARTTPPTTAQAGPGAGPAE